jgi:hypothetical protein
MGEENFQWITDGTTPIPLPVNRSHLLLTRFLGILTEVFLCSSNYNSPTAHNNHSAANNHSATNNHEQTGRVKRDPDK